MKAKHILLNFLVGAASVSSLTANPPLITVGEYADVRALLSVTGKYQDNIFLRDSNKKSDYSATISPGVEIDIGGADRKAASMVFEYREDIIRYSSNSNLDSSNTNLALKGRYETARYHINGLASWRQAQQNTADARLDGVLVRREITNLALSGEYKISTLFNVGSGISYEETRYKNGNFRNSDNLTIPVNLYYDLTPNYAVSVGYRYRDTTVKRGNNRQTHFFNVGIRGEILPRLNGSVQIGYDYVDIANQKSRSGLGADAHLTYLLTPKARLILSFSKDFNTAANGSITDKTGGTLTAVYDINPLWSADANIGYTNQAYKDSSGRTDRITSAGVGVSYTPESYLKFSAGYNLQVNDSTISRIGYTNNVFDISASLRY
jgi:hypothetical protein